MVGTFIQEGYNAFLSCQVGRSLQWISKASNSWQTGPGSVAQDNKVKDATDEETHNDHSKGKAEHVA